jgi:hypothetical protein
MPTLVWMLMIIKKKIPVIAAATLASIVINLVILAVKKPRKAGASQRGNDT